MLDSIEYHSYTWMSRKGSAGKRLRSVDFFTPIYPIYNKVITYLLTIDPNFQRDIQAAPHFGLCTASQALLLQYIEAFSLQILAEPRPACCRFRRFLLFERFERGSKCTIGCFGPRTFFWQEGCKCTQNPF